MARSYRRDAQGRFSGGGGGGGGKSGASKKASATAKKPKARGIEARIDRSSKVRQDYDRKSDWSKNMTPQKLQRMAKRKQQQKQALANLYAKQTPSNQKRAMTALKRTRIMN